MLSVLALSVPWVRLRQHARVGLPTEVLLSQPVDVAVFLRRWNVGVEEVTSFAALLHFFGQSLLGLVASSIVCALNQTVFDDCFVIGLVS